MPARNGRCFKATCAAPIVSGEHRTPLACMMRPAAEATISWRYPPLHRADSPKPASLPADYLQESNRSRTRCACFRTILVQGWILYVYPVPTVPTDPGRIIGFAMLGHNTATTFCNQRLYNNKSQRHLPASQKEMPFRRFPESRRNYHVSSQFIALGTDNQSTKHDGGGSYGTAMVALLGLSGGRSGALLGRR